MYYADVVLFIYWLVMIGLIALVVIYILNGVALMTIARRQGVTYNWLAWIPFGNVYLLGELGVSDVFGLVLTSFHLIYCLDLWLTFLPFVIRSLLFVTLWALWCVGFHGLYRKISREPIAMSVATALSITFLGSIFLFIIRNNEIKDEDWCVTKHVQSMSEDVSHIEENLTNREIRS